MKELSLFTGIGGGLLGSMLLGWHPVGYVEFDDYCQRLLRQRIDDGFLPNAPIFGDLRTFNRDGYAEGYQGLVDVITAGFPCQPFSFAGKKIGADDQRNMWPATIETIRLVRPKLALLENVPGLLYSGYFGTILGDLAESGYDARWRILSAAEVGAPHRRDRLWIVAYAAGDLRGPSGNDGREASAGAGYPMGNAPELGRHEAPVARSGGDRQSEGKIRGSGGFSRGEDVAYAYDPGLAEREGQPGDDAEKQSSVIGSSSSSGEISDTDEAPTTRQREHGRKVLAWTKADGLNDYCEGWWSTEPGLGRLADGVPNRLDRLRGAGNGQVPGVVAIAWWLLTDQFYGSSDTPPPDRIAIFGDDGRRTAQARTNARTTKED